MLTKNIVLCADDYGLNRQVSQGILQLIAKQRLSATSCMVNFPDWIELAKPLTAYTNQVDIGLHFNLTEGQPLTGTSSLSDLNGQFFKINQLILSSLFKKINKQDVVNELNAQLDQFDAAFNRLPNYIDGHQHVHHLPVIRDAVLTVYQHRLRSHQVYLRSVKLPFTKMMSTPNLKVFIIQLTGAHQFAQLLKMANIPHNQSFAGFYDFNPLAKYRELFTHFLNNIDDKGLIMCHPGLINKDELIGVARQNELNYFISEQFLQDCQTYQIKIGQFNRGC